MVLAQPAVVTQSCASTSSNDTEMEEDVVTLSTLVGGKTPPAAQTIMDATREKRKLWLKKEVSITEIFEKYPCLKISKWVSNTTYVP